MPLFTMLAKLSTSPPDTSIEKPEEVVGLVNILLNSAALKLVGKTAKPAIWEAAKVVALAYSEALMTPWLSKFP